MSSWRDQILSEFTPKVARLTLVADPDGLLPEEGILEGVRERGFELIPFEDHIAFRYAYESKFRSRWDRGEHTDLPAPRRGKFFVYVLKCSDSSFYVGQTEDIPRRLRQHKAGEVSWTSKHLPVEIIHWEEFDSRDGAVQREKELKTGFGRKWLKREYEHDRLAARQAGLVVVLRSQVSDLSGLPYDLLQAGRRLSFNLGDIFPNLSYPVVTALDRGDLDALYEAQKRHAPGQLGDNATKEFVLRHVFEIAPELVKQPSDLLRVLLRQHYRGQRIPTDLDERFIQLLRQSTLFDDWPLETLVTDREAFFAFLQERWPIFLDREAAKGASGVREGEKSYGLAIEGPVDLPFDHHDIRAYIDSLQTSIPADDAKHTDWFHFARGWAELALLANEQSEGIPEQTGERIKSLQAQVDNGFTAWISKRYAGLVNLPPVPPVMLHHLPRFLARQVGKDRNAKIALIVVDGLAMDQWLVVRSALATRQPGFRFREQAVFAWIPSLTSVSRQAAFAGKAPIFFPNSIQTTDKEPALWAQFWADQGFTPNEVVYIKGLGDGSLENLSEALSHPRARVAGLVVDKVDKIMHGMEMGTAGMHNQVRQWAQQPYLNTLLDLLLDRGFHVYLTSDHGNVEAEGCGRPAEESVADLRGERVRIYPDAALRGKVKERFPAALKWGPVGLPKDYLALLAPARQAFVQEKQRTVSHGGISVEEIIVPLVQIERRGE